MIDRDWKVIYSRMDGCVITAKKKVAAELLQQKWFPFGKKIDERPAFLPYKIKQKHKTEPYTENFYLMKTTGTGVPAAHYLDRQKKVRKIGAHRQSHFWHPIYDTKPCWKYEKNPGSRLGSTS